MIIHGSPQNRSGNATRSSAFTTSGRSSKPGTNHAQPPKKPIRSSIMTPVTSYRNEGWDTSTTFCPRALKGSPIDRSGAISSHSAWKLSESPPEGMRPGSLGPPQESFHLRSPVQVQCSLSMTKCQQASTYMAPAYPTHTRCDHQQAWRQEAVKRSRPMQGIWPWPGSLSLASRTARRTHSCLHYPL